MSERDLEAAMPRVDETMEAALATARSLLDEDLVEGVGQGETPDGDPCVVVTVSVRTPELDQRIPVRIEGVPVEVVETGPFTALGSDVDPSAG